MARDVKAIQRELAAALAHRGEASLAELAEDVGRTVNGVSQSIWAVVNAGFAECIEGNGGRDARFRAMRPQS